VSCRPCPSSSAFLTMHHLRITLKIVQLSIICFVIIRNCSGHESKTYSESHYSPSITSSQPAAQPLVAQHKSSHHFLPNLFHLRPKRQQESHHNIASANTVTYSPSRLHSSFLKAAKGDLSEAWERFHETLAWRRKERIDHILHEKNEHFDIIKTYYPHYFHLRGWKNEPVYYEKPAKMNLGALKRRGEMNLKV